MLFDIFYIIINQINLIYIILLIILSYIYIHIIYSFLSLSITNHPITIHDKIFNMSISKQKLTDMVLQKMK